MKLSVYSEVLERSLTLQVVRTRDDAPIWVKFVEDVLAQAPEIAVRQVDCKLIEGLVVVTAEARMQFAENVGTSVQTRAGEPVTAFGECRFGNGAKGLADEQPMTTAYNRALKKALEILLHLPDPKTLAFTPEQEAELAAERAAEDAAYQSKSGGYQPSGGAGNSGWGNNPAPNGYQPRQSGGYQQGVYRQGGGNGSWKTGHAAPSQNNWGNNSASNNGGYQPRPNGRYQQGGYSQGGGNGSWKTGHAAPSQNNSWGNNNQSRQDGGSGNWNTGNAAPQQNNGWGKQPTQNGYQPPAQNGGYQQQGGSNGWAPNAQPANSAQPPVNPPPQQAPTATPASQNGGGKPTWTPPVMPAPQAPTALVRDLSLAEHVLGWGDCAGLSLGQIPDDYLAELAKLIPTTEEQANDIPRIKAYLGVK